MEYSGYYFNYNFTYCDKSLGEVAYDYKEFDKLKIDRPLQISTTTSKFKDKINDDSSLESNKKDEELILNEKTIETFENSVLYFDLIDIKTTNVNLSERVDLEYIPKSFAKLKFLEVLNLSG